MNFLSIYFLFSGNRRPDRHRHLHLLLRRQRPPGAAGRFQNDDFLPASKHHSLLLWQLIYFNDCLSGLVVLECDEERPLLQEGRTAGQAAVHAAEEEDQAQEGLDGKESRRLHKCSTLQRSQ